MRLYGQATGILLPFVLQDVFDDGSDATGRGLGSFNSAASASTNRRIAWATKNVFRSGGRSWGTLWRSNLRDLPKMLAVLNNTSKVYNCLSKLG